MSVNSQQMESAPLLARGTNRAKSFLSEFKAFVAKGNVVDLAVAVVIGAAFNAVVTSLVSDIIMPPVGLIVSSNFANWYVSIKGPRSCSNYNTPALAQAAGCVTLNIGVFLQKVVNFVIIAFFLFLILKVALRRKAPSSSNDDGDESSPKPKPRLCEFCKQNVHKDAVRCNHCTSQLKN